MKESGNILRRFSLPGKQENKQVQPPEVPREEAEAGSKGTLAKKQKQITVTSRMQI